MVHNNLDRRSFLKHAAGGAVAAPFFIRNLLGAPPSDKLRLASFGAGGMAYYTLDGIASHKSVSLTCVAEVDSGRVAQMQQKYPNVKVYTDWRQMLDKEHKQHRHRLRRHARPHARAHGHERDALGMHVYVQKPLAHDIYEVRDA